MEGSFVKWILDKKTVDQIVLSITPAVVGINEERLGLLNFYHKCRSNVKNRQ